MSPTKVNERSFLHITLLAAGPWDSLECFGVVQDLWDAQEQERSWAKERIMWISVCGSAKDMEMD